MLKSNSSLFFALQEARGVKSQRHTRETFTIINERLPCKKPSSSPSRYNAYIKLSAKKNVPEQRTARAEIVYSANVCLKMKKKTKLQIKHKRKQTWELQVNYQLVQPESQSLNTEGGSVCESSGGCVWQASGFGV